MLCAKMVTVPECGWLFNDNFNHGGYTALRSKKLEEVIMDYLKTLIEDEPIRKADN
jgi:hypothetical protein